MIIGTAESRTESRPASFRWKAFAIHLALSLVVLGVLLYILFYYWFPDYLFDTDGGWQALRVIAGVDIILGPLLTLIAANPTKSSGELRKDFTVIGIIQVCALSAGTWLAWDNRPYAMLWYDGVVYSLPWSALKNEESALDGIRRVGDSKDIHHVFVDIPFDPQLRSAVIKEAVEHDVDPVLYGRLYKPWPAPVVLMKAFSQISLEMAGEQTLVLQDALAELRSKHPDAVLVPVRSRYEAYFMAMNAKTGESLGTIRVEPNQKLLAGGYSQMRMQVLVRGE